MAGMLTRMDVSSSGLVLRPSWRFLMRHPAHFIAFGGGAGLAPFVVMGTWQAYGKENLIGSYWRWLIPANAPRRGSEPLGPSECQRADL